MTNLTETLHLMLQRSISITVALLASAGLLFAQQTQFSPGFSWRAYSGTITPPLCPEKLCHNYPMVSWNDKYQEFTSWKSSNGDPNAASSFMNFRVAFPPGYNQADSTKKYPMIVMLHGGGESGRLWEGRYEYEATDPRLDNNSNQLKHGGNEHQIAVNKPASDPRSFPGIVVFPQVNSSGSWSGGWENGALSQNQNYVIDIITYMIKEYHADLNRVVIHGLSNGARGIWDTSMKRPDLFAAVLGMSGIPFETDSAAKIHNTTPVRLYQGGLDENPSPGASQGMIDKLVAQGGNPQYYFYPNNGHNTWATAYAEPDFFSWILAQDKRRIHVFGGSTQLCDGATKKLGFSAGMTAYRWKKDGVIINGETTRYLNIIGSGNYTGSYLVEFKRPNDTTWYQSFPVIITTPQGVSYTPELTVSGSLIHPLTKENGQLIGNTVTGVPTTLQAPAGFSEYYWYKNNSLVATTTSNTRLLGLGSLNNAQIIQNVGVWKVTVKESSGCISNFSNTKTLVYNGATSYPYHTSPAGPDNGEYYTGIGQPLATAVSEKKMLITWTDNAAEAYFEIWRERRGAGGYPTQGWNLIAEVPANTTSFIDEIGLRPNAQYGYSIRAIANNDGRFSRKTRTSPWPKTNVDLQAPTAPSNLQVITTTETSIGISWSASIDNDVVYSYEVFSGPTLIATLINDNTTGDLTDGNPPPPTFYTFSGLDPGTTYLLNVRAVDFSGNKSAFPEPLAAETSSPVNGVAFKYYKLSGNIGGPNGSQLAEPNGTFNFLQPPTQTGVVNNFDISGAVAFQGTTNPDQFVYAFDSYLQIDAAGTYTFWTRSDDGSRLYINGTLVVNNDATHGNRNRNGLYTFLAPGKYSIRVTYFEQTGTVNTLGVKYRAGDFVTIVDPNGDANYNAAGFIPNNKLWLTGLNFTNYYSKATGDLNVLSTWGSNPDGSGTIPSSFTNNYQFFNIANRSSATLTNSWTVSGTSSRVIVGDNITFSQNAVMNAKLYANAGSVINLNNSSLPQLITLDATSTVNMNVAGIVPAAVYGNLNLKTSATTKTLPPNGASVKGNLTVDNQVTFNGTATNQSTLVVYGDITFNGTSGNPPLINNRYSLSFKGDYLHTINLNQYDLFLQNLEVGFGATLNINFNSSSSYKISVGNSGLSGGLLLRSGSKLNLGNNNLEVFGSYGVNPTDDSGEISINGGSITVSTNSALTSNLYLADGSVIKNFNLNMTGRGQLNVLNNARLKDLMMLSAGTTNLFGNFILNSDATGTARIGPLGSGARINGNVTFQRFMEGEGQIYRYISSPVKGFRVADIQQYIPVTGRFTGSSGSASMFHYHINGYQNFPQTNGTNQDTLRRGKGYVIFVRQATAPTTWEATGNPHQGTIPFVLTGGTNNPGDGWNLLGNPYPAPIKWTGAQGTQWSTFQNISQTVYIRENFILNGVRQYRFQVYNPNIVPSGLNYSSFDGVIAPGQAFWVQTTTANPSLSITEQAKEITDRSFFRSADDLKKDVLSIILKRAELSDVAYVLYTDSSSENYDKVFDAVKMDNSFFNLTTLSKDNIALSINATPETFCEKEIPLNITNAPAGNYSLSFEGLASFKRLVKMQLKDNFLGTQVEITPDLIYTFSITSDINSTGKSRFVIIEKPILKNTVSLSVSPVCESNPSILIIDSQPGVNYQVFLNGISVSENIYAISDSTSITLDKKLIGVGEQSVTITSRFSSCTDLTQHQMEKIRIDSLNTPVISLSSGLLVTNISQADKYQWFLDGHILKEETNTTLTPLQSGNYEVEVTSKSCVKRSPLLTYLITANKESQPSAPGVYPNPFHDSLIISLHENEEANSIIISNLMGQILKQIPIGTLPKTEMELDLSNLPSGTYIITVGAKNHRVIKQQ